MTTNPHILPQEILECPKDCPFLGMRTFMPNTLPFYCNQYETFLGATPKQNVRRCAACRGVSDNIVETGLSFIESYIVDHYRIEATKLAFMKLAYGFQKMFVDLVSKTGVQIVLDAGEEGNSDTLSDKLLAARQEVKDRYGSPEAQEFKDLLDGPDMPMMSRQTKTLLTNLFLVLDNSEKEMLKSILQNANQVEAFLSSFQKQPQDQDLLANTRALIYDYDRQNQQAQELEKLRVMGRGRRMSKAQEAHLNFDRQKEQQMLQLQHQRELRQNIREHDR